MPRIARAVAVGLPHHITQRGNYGVDIFLSDEDREIYLGWLREYSDRYGVSIWAWCLMSNHVHFIAVPKAEDSLSRAFNQSHMRFAQRVHRSRGLTGHLWQGRFHSSILEGAHLWAAVRYVERNPVRAGLVRSAWTYAWSSAKAHVTGATDPLIRPIPKRALEVDDWRAYLRSADDKAWVEAFCLATRTGRPFGGDAFVERMERRLGRQLRRKKAGRPRKRKKRG